MDPVDIGGQEEQGSHDTYTLGFRWQFRGVEEYSEIAILNSGTMSGYMPIVTQKAQELLLGV
jgi:hypothetical protein